MTQRATENQQSSSQNADIAARPLVIIGSGLAGWSAIKEFRKLDTQTPVLMFTRESGDFYAKPALSNAFAQKKDADQLITTTAEKMVSTTGVTLLQNTEVTSIDAATQEVVTSKGRFGYSQLVLANGASAIKLPISGNAANEIISVNSLRDYSRFRGLLFEGARVLIMGAGLIGCEFANDLASSGYQVHVIDPNQGPLINLLPQSASEEMRSALAGLGVVWHLGASVHSISRQGQAELSVNLSDDESLRVDVVLSAVGLKADCELAAKSGAQCDRGILVNAFLQTSLQNVYALGDNTQYASQSLGAGGARTLPYVMPIMNAAKALAQTLTGHPTPVSFPVMPIVIKTPALPLIIVTPAPGTPGEWRSVEAGIWNFWAVGGEVKGFLLMGAQTAQRSNQIKLLSNPQSLIAP